MTAFILWRQSQSLSHQAPVCLCHSENRKRKSEVKKEGEAVCVAGYTFEDGTDNEVRQPEKQCAGSSSLEQADDEDEDDCAEESA